MADWVQLIKYIYIVSAYVNTARTSRCKCCHAVSSDICYLYRITDIYCHKNFNWLSVP